MSTSKNKSQEIKSSRDIAVDRFRGIAIFLVVFSIVIGTILEFANDAPFFKWLIGLTEHHDRDGAFAIIKNFNTIITNRAGLSIADLFAPLFVFIVGLTFVRSFKSREEKVGTKQAYLHMATRFLGLIGIGAIYNGLEGWGDVLSGDKFIEMDLNQKIFMFALFVVLFMVLVTIVSGLFKDKRVNKIASKVLRYTIALIGLANLFFMLVATAEKLGQWQGSLVITEAFGGSVWDWIQTIGVAGLVALPFVKSDKWGRLIVVGVLLTIVTILAQFGAAKVISDKIEGGLWGAFGWTSILLLGSVFAEIKNNKWFYFGLALGLLGLGLFLALGPKFLLTKRGATSNYVMITAGLGALIYAGLGLLNNWKPKFAFFTWWGGNSMVTYVSALALGVLLTLLLAKTLTTTISIWLSILLIVGILAVYTVINWLLHRNNKHIAL